MGHPSFLGIASHSLSVGYHIPRFSLVGELMREVYTAMLVRQNGKAIIIKTSLLPSNRGPFKFIGFRPDKIALYHHKDYTPF